MKIIKLNPSKMAKKQLLKQRIKEIMKRFEGFTDGVRMIMLTQRNKEGGRSNKPDRGAIRKISRNREEFEKILNELLDIKERHPEKTLRIYSCVNKRDIEKGIREFKRRQLEADYYDKESRIRFYLDIKNRFLSSLMIPQSRAETKFLIDIDEDDDESQIKMKLRKLGIKILLEYKTKNGKHIITEPFNPALLPKAEIKKDALLLLDYA